MKPSLSVIIPTYNEEKYIEQAIFCASFAQEVLVIDSFSTDTTVELVKKTGTRLLQRKFDNFSDQKNYAISQASHDWILILDADEYLSYNLQKVITSLLSAPGQEVAYYIPFKNHFINRFIHFGSNGNKKKIRLFNRNFCHYEGLVHEQLIYEGSAGSIDIPILHYTYKSLRHFFNKKNAYSSLQAEQIIQKNKSVTAFHIVVKPPFRYLNEMILRLGILDGMAGLTSTAMNGYGVLSRYVKARNKRKPWKTESLRHYEKYMEKLFSEARRRGQAREKTENLHAIDLYVKPMLVFLKKYFLQLELRNGLEGYILSYLAGFQCFLTLLYQWLNKRDLK